MQHKVSNFIKIIFATVSFLVIVIFSNFGYQQYVFSLNKEAPTKCLPKLILPAKASNDFYEFPNWYQNYSKSQIDFLNTNVFLYAKTVENARNIFFKETECGNYEFVMALYGPALSPTQPASGHDIGFDNYWKKFGNHKFENVHLKTGEIACKTQTVANVGAYSYTFCIDEMWINGNSFFNVTEF
jgi:hypothetical protein